MKQESWRVLSGALAGAVLVGKLMPGSWKNIVMAQWHGPGDLSLTAHLVLFAAVACAVPNGYPQVKGWQVLLLAFALTAVTESLQHFAIGRHPSLMSIALDMTGACVGLGIGLLVRRARQSTQVREDKKNPA